MSWLFHEIHGAGGVRRSILEDSRPEGAWGASFIDRVDSACQRARGELSRLPGVYTIADREPLREVAGGYSEAIRRVRRAIGEPPTGAPPSYRSWLQSLDGAVAAYDALRGADINSSEEELHRLLDRVEQVSEEGSRHAQESGLKVCGSPVTPAPPPAGEPEAVPPRSPEQQRADRLSATASLCALANQAVPPANSPRNLAALADFLDRFVPVVRDVHSMISLPLDPAAITDDFRSLVDASKRRLDSLERLQERSRSGDAEGAQMALTELDNANAAFNSAAEKIGLRDCIVTR